MGLGQPVVGDVPTVLCLQGTPKEAIVQTGERMVARREGGWGDWPSSSSTGGVLQKQFLELNPPTRTHPPSSKLKKNIYAQQQQQQPEQKTEVHGSCH